MANRLRRAREALGLTQKEFAERAGLLPHRYNPWETGERPLPLEGARLLYKRYGISLDWLYEGNPTAMPRWLLTSPEVPASPEKARTPKQG